MLMSSHVGHEIEAVLCSHDIDYTSYAETNLAPPLATSASETANDAAFVNFEFFRFLVIILLWNSNVKRRVIYYI